MWYHRINYRRKEVYKVKHDRLDVFSSFVVGASRSVTRLKGKYMTAYGLGSTHTVCIRRLKGARDGITRTRLAECCELDKAQVSRIVNDLSKKGYVTESPERSRYKRKIRLTEAGMRIADDIDRIVLDINNFVSSEIPEEEINTFYKVFETICNNLKRAEQCSVEDITNTRKELNHG